MKYRITAHHCNTGREFHTTVEALSSQHAGGALCCGYVQKRTRGRHSVLRRCVQATIVL